MQEEITIMNNKPILLCATNNNGKLTELKQLLPQFEVKGLKDLGITTDIPETADSFDGNALQKVRFLAERYPDLTIIADDSGLCVEALHGAPGVFSARYAGEKGNAAANNQKLLAELKGENNRSAYFTCVIALYRNHLEYVFEGRVDGAIAEQTTGEGGFGYDPLFIPEGYDKSFAELPTSVKSGISHRANAVAQLTDFLSR